jgi:hypothetical protein
VVYSSLDSWFIEEAIEGNPVAVKAIEKRPEIEPYLRFVWDAFWELGCDRPIGFGALGAIPFSSVDRYARRFGIDDSDQFSRFLHLIRQLDAKYLALVNDPGKTDAASKS